MTIEIRKNELGKLASQYPKRASQIVRATGYKIITLAAPITPYKTGNLSGQVEVTMTGASSANVNWRMSYAIYQNYGTRYVAAHHFAEQSAALAKDGFVSALKAALAA